jgi:hypothetical protein
MRLIVTPDSREMMRDLCSRVAAVSHRVNLLACGGTSLTVAERRDANYQLLVSVASSF